MSVTITKATLELNLPYYLVEVLRNELSDTHTPARAGKLWIHKSQTTDHISPDDLPRIYLDTSPLRYASWNLTGTCHDVESMQVDCMVMCGGSNTTIGRLGDRDTFANAIRTVLFNPESEDVDELKLRENHIVMRSFNSEVADFYLPDHPSIVRAKSISMIFKYFGN